MLTLLSQLNSAYFLAANIDACRTTMQSINKLNVLDDLFAAYCCIDFLKEI